MYTRMTHLLVLSVTILAGCASRSDSGRWIRQATEIHQEADAALEQDDRLAAIRHLEQVLTLPAPSGVAVSDVRVVKQDACFRIALLNIEAGQADRAKDWAQRGLDFGRGQDLYTANLLVARGRALGAMGQDRQAAEDYHQALLINELLLNRALPDAPRGDRP